MSGTTDLDKLAISISGVDPLILESVVAVINSPEFRGIHDADFHKYRYCLSIQFLKQELKNQTIKKVLELGEPGPFTSIAKVFFPEWEFFHQTEDLRNGIKFNADTFDLVISTEVLEHIADLEIGHEITSEGVKDHLRDVYRVLKKDGLFFITTPNASSIWCIKRILMQEPPLIYENHYREFSHLELANLISNSDFRILVHESIIVWNFWDFEDIKHFMKERNYDLKNRGDDQFLLAIKEH